MDIKIIKPLKYMVCSGGITLGYELENSGYDANQVEDMIRKVLLERSIIADKIEVNKNGFK